MRGCTLQLHKMPLNTSERLILCYISFTSKIISKKRKDEQEASIRLGCLFFLSKGHVSRCRGRVPGAVPLANLCQDDTPGLGDVLRLQAQLAAGGGGRGGGVYHVGATL